MIQSASIPAVVMAAAVLIAGADRYVIYKRRRFREDLSFSVSCLIFCLYAIACVALYSAETPYDGGYWQRVQFLTAGFLTVALLKFFLDYTGHKARGLLLLLGGPSVLLGLVNGLWASSWTVSAAATAIKHLQAPWGVPITYNEMAVGPLVALQMFWSLLVVQYGWLVIWRMSRKETGSRFKFLLASFTVFSITAVADALIGLEAIALPYTMEYGFFALVVFMGFQSADELARAAEAEQRVRQSEARYRDLFENTGTLMGIINEDMTLGVVNAEWERFTGYPKSLIEGRMLISDFMPEEDRPGIRANHEKRRRQSGEVPRSYEVRLLTRVGQSVPALATVSMIPGTRQSVISLIDISAIKKVEADLRESQDLLRLVLDHVPQRIFWKDENSVILGCNSCFAQDFGFKDSAEVVGKTDYDLTAVPAEAESYRRCDREVLQSGRALLRITETHTRADGRVSHLETSKVPMLDAGGGVRRVLGTYEDITERIKADEQLKKRESEFRALFTTMAEGMAVHELVYDGEGRVVDYRLMDVNPAFTRHTGITRERAVGQTSRALYGVAEAPFLKELSCVALGGEPVLLDFFFPPLSRHYHVSVYSPMRGRFVSIFEDVTEKIKLSEIAKENEDRFRHVVESTQDGIFIADGVGLNISYANPALGQLLGCDPADLVGRHWTAMVEANSHRTVRALVDKARLHQVTRPSSFMGKRQSGSTFVGEIQASAIMTQGRQSVLGIVRDISERRQVEQGLVAMSEREQQRLGRELHDVLGQKLTGLKFLAQGMGVRLRSSQDGELVQVARSVEETATQCIADARRMAAGLFPHKLEQDDLSEALRDLAENISRWWSGKCVYSEATLAIPPGQTMALHLYRIAQEATNNAIKHGKASQIEVGLMDRGRDYVLTVSDDGQGMAVGSASPRGLGLRIMHYRASLLNGVLEILSKAGGGTVVRCVVPVADLSAKSVDEKEIY